MIGFRRRPARAAADPAPSNGGDAAAFTLAVVCPGARDAEQHFPAGAGQPDAAGAVHPPINFHAFAACTGGSFHSRIGSALATGRPALLLLRRDLGAGLRGLRRLKNAGRTVVLSFKEAGASQIAARVHSGADLQKLAAIVQLADGCLAPVPWMLHFLQAFLPPAPRGHPDRIVFLPTPYPVDDSRWNFSLPPAQRRGVLVDTREFGVPARQHLRAVLSARQLHQATGEPVTVLNPEGRAGAKPLEALGFSARPGAALRIVPGPLSYADYLRLMARHKLVFQLDRSGVPGQVAGDALLCRLPCVGGDGAIEQVAFPQLCGLRREADELIALAADLLTQPAPYEQAWRDAQARALRDLSFGVTAERLRAIYAALGPAR